jgi:thiamine-monophosphate kinase
MYSEFGFIEKIRRRSVSRSAKIGIGDDCAVIAKDSKTDLVITADLLVEDIDFRLDWTTPELVGHKALAISLSDIAAMGAKPVWALLSIGVPEKIWNTDFPEKFYDGWFAIADKFNVELVGGDVSKTPDKIVIDSIVAGEVKKNKAVLRSGAKTGDLIFVTGELGGGAGGLKLLDRGVWKNPEQIKLWQMDLLNRQRQPFPQISIGTILSERNLASAMIDLSDGLSSDLAHLCAESKVGAKIEAHRIPIHKKLSEISPLKNEALELALNGGEDFELLFTVNPKKISRLKKVLTNYKITCIGEMTANAEMIELVSASGSSILQPAGFRHF